MEQKRKEKKYASKNVCSSNNPSHSFAVDRVDSKQHGRYEDAGSLTVKHVDANKEEDEWRQNVQKNINKMITKRFKLSNEVVEAICSSADGSERFVASTVPEWCTPEVVCYKDGPGWRRMEISIRDYCSPVE